MTEVEKLYRNAGIEKEKCYGCSDVCTDCNKNYPPFTAEKQLELIKLISLQGQVVIENWKERGFNVEFRANSNMRYITMDCITRKTVEEAIAQIINDIWQDLTEEERAQIKEILE